MIKYSKDIDLSIEEDVIYIRIYRKRLGVWCWGKTYSVKKETARANRIYNILEKYSPVVNCMSSYSNYINGKHYVCQKYRLNVAI